MDFYEFARACMDQGLTSEDAALEWYLDLEARRAEYIDACENDPLVAEGWRQDDLIDMYRRER